MRLWMDRLKRLSEGLLLLVVMLASWGSNDAAAQFFSSSGGGSGGFTGRPLITVEISADKTSVPVNLSGFAPNPSLPYTSTITVAVKQDGRLLPSDIQLDLAPNLAQGALFDPADLTQGFRSLSLSSTSGIGTAFFNASSTSGVVTITATAQDPSTQQTVSSSVQITVVGESRPATSITFTGAYVNAVTAGLSRFGDPQIQDGTYSRVVSAVVTDANGNPTNPNTQINFFLIDGPIIGYPSSPGTFTIAGSDGNPLENGSTFSAPTGKFLTNGVRVADRLVLADDQLRTVQSVTSESSLTIQSGRPFGSDSSPAIPYIIGRATNAAILSPSFTDISGVASTTLTYPVTRVGQTAVLVACTADYSACGILNTCDTSGANCKSVFLGATNGSDRTLTISATTLGPNRTTDVQLCLKDVNFTPLAATEIRYSIGSTGPAKVTITQNGQATVTDSANNKGKFLTGEDGCTTVAVASSGQIPGGQPIEIQFTADYVAASVPVTIKAPGAGKMDGFFSCEFQFDKATATCTGTLRLTDDEGSPMSGILIALGKSSAAFPFTLTFDPAEGVFGKTNDQGQVQVTIQLDGPGDYTFPFQTASGGTASFEFDVTVPTPGTLKVTMEGDTTATVGTLYSAVLQADGGVPPYSWSLLAGSLPPGLSLSSSGAISGTPTTKGSFSFSVQAKDSKGLTGFAAFTIKVESSGDSTTSLSISTSTLADGKVGTFYTALLAATGGTTPYTWSVLSGVLPGGISLNSSTGVLSGTPTAPGTFNFVAQVTDSEGATALANFALVVANADGSGGDTVTPSSLILLVSSPDLPSSGQPSVTLTAIARDSKGVLLENVSVQFQVKSTEADGVTPNGTIQVVSSITDETGVATATLSTGGNKRNRTITVGAASGTVTAADVTVNVTGTTLEVSGASSGTDVLLGDTVKLIFTLSDSAGTGIANANLNIASVLNGLAISPATSTALGSALTATTNSSGVAEVTLTVNQNGQDTVSATWEGVSSYTTTTTLPLTLNAAPDSVVITVKDNTTGKADNVGIAPSFGNVVVTWLQNGAPVVGATIKLNTTKGTLSATQGVTDGNGQLTGITISSIVPGSSVITATGTQGTNTVSTQKTIQFGATTPAQMTLQAKPSTIALNVPPATSSQSTITATVRDVNDNPVPNQTVTFSVTQDTSGGSLSSATASTDAAGQASVVYTAGSSATKENGVIVQATVGALIQQVTLTVSKREVFITLGTGNTITELNSTTYALPYNVLVNDIVGGAVSGATVTLDTVPSQYRKGQYVWNGKVWVPVVAISCPNEDLNNNGILDSGEDANGNGVLDPGNVVTPSVASITTDTDGFGDFDVLYAQQYANWIFNVLTASTKVGGSEDVETAHFVLPALSSDLTNQTVSPPGQPSPFGVLPNCTVSVEQEAGMTLTTDVPATGLKISVGGTSFGPTASVNGSVTVTVNLPSVAVDLTGTTVAAETSSIVDNVDVAAPISSFTTGSVAVITVTVTNTSTVISVPVPASGTLVGTVTFTVGNAKTVFPVTLIQ